MKKNRQFKFLREGLKSNYDGFQWEIKKWHRTKCVEPCYGFNCSEKILDALGYVSGEILAEVEARGNHFAGNDKSTWAEMRILRAWKWKQRDSVALAVFAAESVIEIYETQHPADERPRRAIEAAKIWLSAPSDKLRDAAWAAGDAAWAAAGAAGDAAGAAAGAAWAAGDAAWAAGDAWAAAGAAGDAAGAAALNKINDWLIKHLDEMDEWQP